MPERRIHFNELTAAKLLLVNTMRNAKVAATFAKAGLPPPDEETALVMALEAGLDLLISQNVRPHSLGGLWPNELPNPGDYGDIVPIAVGPQRVEPTATPFPNGPAIQTPAVPDDSLGEVAGIRPPLGGIRLTFQLLENGETEILGFVEEQRGNRFTKRPRVWNAIEVQVLTRLFQGEPVNPPAPLALSDAP